MSSEGSSDPVSTCHGGEDGGAVGGSTGSPGACVLTSDSLRRRLLASTSVVYDILLPGHILEMVFDHQLGCRANDDECSIGGSVSGCGRAKDSEADGEGGIRYPAGDGDGMASLGGDTRFSADKPPASVGWANRCGRVARRRRDFLNTGVASARVRSDRFAVLSIAIDRCSALEAQVSRHE